MLVMNGAKSILITLPVLSVRVFAAEYASTRLTDIQFSVLYENRCNHRGFLSPARKHGFFNSDIFERNTRFGASKGSSSNSHPGLPRISM